MITKFFFVIISGLLLVYMMWPAPTSINSFPALPDSTKSKESGDTIQVSNVSAYFSKHYRQFVTNYYKNYYQQLTGLPFPPLRMNHPPEFAYTAIKDQTQSTYLEEFYYPLRGSLYVNGFEPFYEDGTAKFVGATDMVVDGKFYSTKTTLRYFPSRWSSRLIVWFGLNITFIALWKMGKRVLSNA
jgi:hypothetical protein